MKEKKLITLLPLLILILFITSCGEEEGEEGEGTATSTITKQGFHMPGRDCLACHNYDLQTIRHLTVGGTVFKTQTINNVNDVNNLCGGNLKIKLIDANNPSNVIDSTDYEDPNSKGYKGKGNIFILTRKYPNLQGNFYIKITDENNNVIATSQTPHKFELGYYDITNPTDPNNRYSCNACHSVSPKGGAPGVIYPNTNSNLCE